MNNSIMTGTNSNCLPSSRIMIPCLPSFTRPCGLRTFSLVKGQSTVLKRVAQVETDLDASTKNEKTHDMGE